MIHLSNKLLRDSIEYSSDFRGVFQFRTNPVGPTVLVGWMIFNKSEGDQIIWRIKQFIKS